MLVADADEQRGFPKGGTIRADLSLTPTTGPLLRLTVCPPGLSVIAPIVIALPSQGPRAPRRHADGQNQAEHKRAAAPFRDPVRPRQPASRYSPLLPIRRAQPKNRCS